MYSLNMQLAAMLALKDGFDCGKPLRDVFGLMVELSSEPWEKAGWEAALRAYEMKSVDVDVAVRGTLLVEVLRASNLFGQEVMLSLSFSGLSHDSLRSAIRYLSVVAGAPGASGTAGLLAA